MNRAVEANLALIRHVAARLSHLLERVVFPGGAATALLITDEAAPDIPDADSPIPGREWQDWAFACHFDGITGWPSGAGFRCSGRVAS